MPGPADSKFKAMAAEMADRLDRARACGEQLSFLPDPDRGGGQLIQVDEKRGPGRPEGSRNRRDNQLRKMLAAQGFRMPEDQLVRMAGLDSREDPVTAAMALVERLLAWAGDGASRTVWNAKNARHEQVDFEPDVADRLEAFFKVWPQMQKAAEALLPYGLDKATPDVPGVVAQVVVLPSGQDRYSGDQEDRLLPPPFPHEVVENQWVDGEESDSSDNPSRTEGLKR